MALLGAIAWMLATNFGGVHDQLWQSSRWLPLLGAMLGCHCWVPLLGAIAGVPLLGAIARTNWPECCTILRCTLLCIDNTQIGLCYLGSMLVYFFRCFCAGFSSVSFLYFYNFPQTYSSSTMRPITTVKRFLKGETPSVPLPPGIDDDATSNPSTASWLLVSQSGTQTQTNHIKNTKDVECQTTPFGQPLYHRPRACAKHFFDSSKDAPASVPSFSPRSNFLSYITEAFKHLNFIVLLHRRVVRLIRAPHNLCNISDQLPNRFRRRLLSEKPLPRCNLPQRRTLQKPNVLAHNSEPFSTTSNSHPSFSVKFTILSFWTYRSRCRQSRHGWPLSLHADLESLGMLVPVSHANPSWSTTLSPTRLFTCL